MKQNQMCFMIKIQSTKKNKKKQKTNKWIKIGVLKFLKWYEI